MESVRLAEEEGRLAEPDTNGERTRGKKNGIVQQNFQTFRTSRQGRLL